MHRLYLGLGSNIGNREETINRALSLIQERLGPVVRTSSFIETEPWGFESKNAFINACCLVHTELSPEQCLHETQEIERNLGRLRKSANRRYHDRTIDIDILLYDDLKVDLPGLQIPHPLMHERDFVMVPLLEIMERE